MTNVEPKGAVHWIDHYVVGTNDLPSWTYWALNATGLPIRPINGLTTNNRKKNTPIFCFMWWDGGSCRIGAFLQPDVYPSAKELGKDLPRVFVAKKILDDDVTERIARAEARGELILSGEYVRIDLAGHGCGGKNGIATMGSMRAQCCRVSSTRSMPARDCARNRALPAWRSFACSLRAIA